MIANFASERVWVEKNRFDQAERQFHELASKLQKDLNCATNNKIQHNGNPIIGEKLTPTPTQIKSNNNKNMMADGNENVQLTKNHVKSKKSKINDEFVETTVEASTATARKKNKKHQNKVAKQQQQQLQQQPQLAKELVLPKQQKHDVNVNSCSSLSDDKNAADKSMIISNTSNKATDNKNVAKSKGSTTSGNQSTLVSEIAKAREHIKNSLEKMDGIATLASSSSSAEVMDRITSLEKNTADLTKLVDMLQKRLSSLEVQISGKQTATPAAPAAKAPVTKSADNDDDDVDLFGSDEDDAESAEAAELREKRLAAYAEKKSKKPALIAKSSLVLDIKPWDDETDLKLMEAEIRKIVADGLLWGASKFAPVAYGIQKLTISCVVEDEKISIDWLTEEIEKLEDYVQSVDVAAFNKI